MTKLRETKARRARRAAAWLVLLACAACAFVVTSSSRAQSGRRSPTMSKTSPAPPAAAKTVEATPTATKKDVKPLASFVIAEDTGSAFEVDYTARRIVLGAFVARLDQSSVVAVTSGGRMTRKEARDRAKNQTEAFVVLVELEEELDGINMRGGRSRPEDRLLVIKSYVYTPATGDLKFTDRFVARPYDTRASVGGVRVPVPSGGGYGLEAQFERAGRDAAQRLLSRFEIALPPEN